MNSVSQNKSVSQQRNQKSSTAMRDSNKEGDSVSPSGYRTAITTAPRVAHTTTPPTRTRGTTLKYPPSTTFQPPASSTLASPPTKPPQVHYPGQPPSWAQVSTPPSSKQPFIQSTLRLGEKLEPAGEGNGLLKRPRGRGKGIKRGRGLRAGSVRLVSTDGLPNRGRVEIFIRGQWGTVCDDLFTSKAGNVVCRQLGYQTALAVLKRAAFGEADGSVHILLDDVECEGQERSLLDCKRSRVGKHNCSHAEDVGVICG